MLMMDTRCCFLFVGISCHFCEDDVREVSRNEGRRAGLHRLLARGPHQGLWVVQSELFPDKPVAVSGDFTWHQANHSSAVRFRSREGATEEEATDGEKEDQTCGCLCGRATQCFARPWVGAPQASHKQIVVEHSEK